MCVRGAHPTHCVGAVCRISDTGGDKGSCGVGQQGPVFRASMHGVGVVSEEGEQGSGIRQGCTLSRFLVTLVMSAIMHDVEAEVRESHPLATTPAFAVMGLEYADDTVLIARTAEIAGELLRITEEEATTYGLLLNRGRRSAWHTTRRNRLTLQTGPRSRGPSTRRTRVPY